MDIEEFTNQYLIEDKEEGGYTFRNSPPCPFLSGNSCTVYSARPETCRSFPHLHKEGFTSRTLAVICNCSICPIVYNVWEHLKSEIAMLEAEMRRKEYLREGEEE